MNQNNKFFVFEGIDGSGKSTLSKNVYTQLVNKKMVAEHHREPGELFYNTLGGFSVTSKLSPLEETFYMLADRAKHDAQIKELIKNNTIVICDRYIPSTFAYQGIKFMKTVDKKEVLDFLYNLHVWFTMPQTIYYIDTPPEVALERINKRGNEKLECFERLDFMKQCYDVYQWQRSKNLFTRWVTIPYDRTPLVQANMVVADIKKQLKIS